MIKSLFVFLVLCVFVVSGYSRGGGCCCSHASVSCHVSECHVAPACHPVEVTPVAHVVEPVHVAVAPRTVTVKPIAVHTTNAAIIRQSHVVPVVFANTMLHKHKAKAVRSDSLKVKKTIK